MKRGNVLVREQQVLLTKPCKKFILRVSVCRVADPYPDPVFLHGSGSRSGFQISLDPDPAFKFSGSGSGSGFSQDSGKLQKGL